MTVNQEIVGLNPTHGWNLFLSCARSLGLLGPFGKMRTGFWCPGSSTQSRDLKYGSISFTDWLWSVIALVLGFKFIPNVLDKNSTHMSTAYSHLISPAPRTYDHIGNVHHVGIIPGIVYKLDMQFNVCSAILAETNTFCKWQMTSIMCTCNCRYEDTGNKNINLIWKIIIFFF